MAGGLWGPWPGAKTNKQKRKAQQKAYKKKYTKKQRDMFGGR